MKVRSQILRPSVARGIIAVYAAVFVASAPSTTLAAGVVGTGTVASCTDAALNTALAGGGVVTFDCGPGPVTITLTQQKDVLSDTTVDGGGLITLDGNQAVRMFMVEQGGALNVENLTIVNGNAFNDSGGAIYNSGTLIVTNCTFSGNKVHRVPVVAGGAGGAIYNGGTLRVTNSTFSGNHATGIGGAGGAIANGGTLTVTNSTFSSNGAAGGCIITECAGGAGGAIISRGTLTVTNSTFSSNGVSGIRGLGGVGGAINGGSGTVTNSTFSGNSATVDGAAIIGELTLSNTIVARSAGRSCAGSITDGGHNLDDGTSCGFSTANGSLNNTNPRLDPAGLQNNGGPTQTVALCTAVGVPAGCTAASPALYAGDPDICAAAPVNDRDQRGFLRGRGQCSIGAYEADAVAGCTGDCNGTHSVGVNDLITLANIVLGNAQPSACAYGVPSGAGVNVSLIVQGANNALNGCR